MPSLAPACVCLTTVCPESDCLDAKTSHFHKSGIPLGSDTHDTPLLDRRAVEAGSEREAARAVAHGALVPAALSLLVYALQPAAEAEGGALMYESVCLRLFRSPSATLLLDAVFDSVRTQLLMVRKAAAP